MTQVDENTQPIIEFHEADIANGGVTVVGGLDFVLREGEFAYLTGKVGSGKTSIIRTIIGENPLASGEGSVCGFNLVQLNRKQIPYLRRSIGVVFQDFQLLMDRTVEDNLHFVLKATGWKDKAGIRERLDEVLEAVGMSGKAHKMPHQLSGGEQQRIAIARALLNTPKLILADEPTGNLDGETAEGIMKLLMEINGKGTAILMVTHNLNIIRDYPAKVFVCENNTCHEETLSDEKA